jgi:ferredoxin
MSKIKIKFVEEECIGCGTCIALCPENWEMEGSKAKPIKTELEELGNNKIAADSCPVSCIHIVEQK